MSLPCILDCSGHNEMGFSVLCSTFFLSISSDYWSFVSFFSSFRTHRFTIFMSMCLFRFGLVWCRVCMHAVTRNTFNGAKTIFNISRSINAHIRKLCAPALPVRYSLILTNFFLHLSLLIFIDSFPINFISSMHTHSHTFILMRNQNVSYSFHTEINRIDETEQQLHQQKTK